MGCRCSEVIKYAEQLFKLKLAEEYMKTVVDNVKGTEDSLKKSGDNFKTAVILNNAEDSIGEELCEGYGEAVNRCNEAYEEVKSAIETVSDKLKSYREEDKSWHKRKHNSK